MEDKSVTNLMEGKSVFLQNKKVTFGMNNRGNTCFFNSVMQAFVHTVPLHQLALTNSHGKFCKQKDCLLCTFVTFIQRLNKEKRSPLELML